MNFSDLEHGESYWDRDCKLWKFVGKTQYGQYLFEKSGVIEDLLPVEIKELIPVETRVSFTEDLKVRMEQFFGKLLPMEGTYAANLTEPEVITKLLDIYTECIIETYIIPEVKS